VLERCNGAVAFSPSFVETTKSKEGLGAQIGQSPI
jgi:hypothetical protein